MNIERIEIAEGINQNHLHDALRMSYDAFAKKFRIGFRNADDLIRIFAGSIDTTSCISATLNGQLVGILTFSTTTQEFYHLNTVTLLTRFSPIRVIRIIFNLMLLTENVGTHDFHVDSIAVDPSTRGMGVGTLLMQKAEEVARSKRKSKMALGVISENQGAIKLYKRLGYEIIKTHQGFLVRLATLSTQTHRMEKMLAYED